MQCAKINAVWKNDPFYRMSPGNFSTCYSMAIRACHVFLPYNECKMDILLQAHLVLLSFDRQGAKQAAIE